LRHNLYIALKCDEQNGDKEDGENEQDEEDEGIDGKGTCQT